MCLSTNASISKALKILIYLKCLVPPFKNCVRFTFVHFGILGHCPAAFVLDKRCPIKLELVKNTLLSRVAFIFNIDVTTTHRPTLYFRHTSTFTLFSLY